MTTLEYDLIFKEQNGLCAICLKPPSDKRFGNVIALAVDHDHVTGMSRGLLCSKCNYILGSCGDNPKVLLRAIDYLRQYSPAFVE